jgi:hypothetical protein
VFAAEILHGLSAGILTPAIAAISSVWSGDEQCRSAPVATIASMRQAPGRL